jgi:hypothetical protein
MEEFQKNKRGLVGDLTLFLSLSMRKRHLQNWQIKINYLTGTKP